MRSEVFYALDIGGSHICCAVVAGGDVLARQAISPPSAQSIVALLPAIEAALRGMAADRAVQPIGLAIAFPALTDPHGVTVLSTPRGKYEDAVGFRFDDWSRAQLRVPARIEQDARMALLGECAAGVARGCDDVALLALGTGIGSAAMIEGRLLRGRHFQAGSLVGHMSSGLHAVPCICGNVGCAEALASTWAVPRLLEQWDAEGTSVLRHDAAPAFREVMAARQAGDAAAGRIWDHALQVWGATLVNLVHAYDPELVVLTGGITQAGDALLTPLQHHVARHAWTGWGTPRLRLGQLGGDAALLGAAKLWQLD